MVYHRLIRDAVVRLLQDMADLVLLVQIIILRSSQEEGHQVKDRGLFQNLITIHPIHTIKVSMVVNRVLRCNLSGDNSDLLQCSSKGADLSRSRTSISSHRSSSSSQMVNICILPTSNSNSIHLDRVSLNRRDPTQLIIPVGTSNAAEG